MKFVGVTACPTGIAHSAMAAEAIEEAAREKGHEIEVEVHGAMGAEFVSPETIREADAIIFATDAQVAERSRFDGKPKIEVKLREAIDRPGEVVERAEEAAENKSGASAAGTSGADEAEKEDDDLLTSGGGTSKGAEVRRWLMTGVSYMIPFVVAGGILIALAFALGDTVGVTESDVYANFTIPALVYEIGSTAFSMLVPILAGFIAYAMADRPGIAPGVVGGLIANEIGAGFLGGLAAGLLAGAIVMLMKKIKVPGAFGKLMPIIVYPVVGTFVVGAVMILVIGNPIAGATTAMQDWLSGLSGANAALLGLILGAMMAVDLGGPVNKTAYAFAIAGLAGGAFGPMAAVMAAGMVPPLALALACLVRPKLFSGSERRAGQANWLLGASFITEGAIPFAASDPLRVIPAMIAGSSTAAALSLFFGATLRAPHGGIFVIGLIGNWPLYLLAIVIGTIVSAVLVVGLKQFTGGSDEKIVEDAAATSTEQKTATATT